MLEFGLLGPLHATRDGVALPLGGKKQRVLLALLLLARERVVTRDQLVDALWGDRPPAAAVNSIHIYVSKLRRLVGDGRDATDGVIRTATPGYRLSISPSAIDANEFERLLRQGRSAISNGQYGEAEAVLGRSLDLWRGPALADLADESVFQAEIARLERLRLEALTARAGARIGLGREAEAVADLWTLVTEHPLDEELRMQLMLALYRVGRQPEALETYREFRKRLADELGLEPTARLRDVEQAILRQDPSLGQVVPAEPSRLPLAADGDMPVPATSIVGRARELAETAELLEGHRVVTLTGAGGSGKTRLALELARMVAARFQDGVFWVPLQAVRDPALVESAIATAVGADRRVDEHLAFKRVLVLLDNFEQVVDAAPEVAAIAARTAHARFLVTSRQPLELEVERRYEVEPLPNEDAVVLFCERATSVLAAFRATPAVAEICRRLDGLPLALELAAARVVLFAPDELLSRLDAPLPLLASRARDITDRHRTLRKTIDWSYNLLPLNEQRLFRTLAVFRGSFSVAAAEAVCGADVAQLESLVTKSLLRRADGGRLALLDTIREYALEQLARSPEAEGVRRAHAEFFLAVAESANLNAAAGGARLGVANAEQDNFRSALAWALERGDATLGLGLATAMDGFWVAHDPREGIRWFAELFALPGAPEAPRELRAHALRAYGGATDMEGDDAVAKQLYERSLELFEQLEDEWGMGTLLIRLSVQELRRGNVDEARTLVERSREYLERSDDPWGRAMVAGLLGAVARDSGDADRAYALIGRSAELGADAGVPWWQGGMLAELSAIDMRAGRIDEAEVRARESLELADELGDRAGRVLGVGLFAAIAAARGDRARATRLWSAVQQEDTGAPLGGWRRHRGDLEAFLEPTIGGEGRPTEAALSLEDAVALAVR